MIKPSFCICKTKGADQLCGNHAADQRLCFPYIDSSIPLTSYILNFTPLAIFCDCTAQFMSDPVGNPEDMFSHDAAHIMTSLT